MLVFIISPGGMCISFLLVAVLYFIFGAALGFILITFLVIVIGYHTIDLLLDYLLEYLQSKNETPEEQKTRKMIKDWRNGISHTKAERYPTKYELEQQALDKIKTLAKDFVTDFIAKGKTEFSHEDLKDFTVLIKFKNGITIPALEKYSYKEHPLLLDILKQSYNKLNNK